MGAKENKVERYLVERIRNLHGVAYKWISPGQVGVPDRICVVPELGVLFVEVKTVDGVVSDQQLRILHTLHKAGANAAVVRGVYDTDCMLTRWQNCTETFRWGF